VNSQGRDSLPRISVVTAVRNASPWIAETIESVLQQTCPPHELIVVDDGSTDDTCEVVSRYRSSLRLIRIDARGKSVGKNVGIRAASGDYIAFIDGDDLWLPQKLEVQAKVLLARPGLAWVYSDSFLFEGNTDKSLGTFGQISCLHEGNVLRSLLLCDFIPALTVVVRRDVFQDVGDFDEKLLRYQPEDWDLWLRIAAVYPVALVNEPLARYRVHASSLTALETPEFALQGQRDVIELAVARSPELRLLRHKAIANACVGTGRVSARNGQLRMARKMFADAMSVEPRNLRHYGYWLATFFGSFVVKKAIALRRLLSGRPSGMA
jgi:GT2 family glycosyltransferase